ETQKPKTRAYNGCGERLQNIGYEMGENGWTPQWYRVNHRTPWVATLKNGSKTLSPAKQSSNRRSVESACTE
ncbi:MAG: hypothetical protein P1U77_28465, partial [Rubripirellula sp.]|nr:hypothetical protein [Rubripirellula sp.]